jgi:hypothetical protein
VLRVVEHEQLDAGCSQLAGDSGSRIGAGSELAAERGGDRRAQLGARACGREVAEQHAAQAGAAAATRSECQRDARLADPRRADQRDQPRLAEQGLEPFERGAATEQRGQRFNYKADATRHRARTLVF